MKLSDYVIDFLAKQGIYHSFFVSGGAVVHLVDSASRHSEMMCIPCQHEEHSAAAADMYARVTGNLGLAMSTSGPGATNMVTSICNAYVDSIPLLCLTGQVARFRLKKTPELRQRGFQETDVVSICKSITKYVALVTDPLEIRFELEKAIYFAKEGRPGPVVLDIPDDLQREEIEPDSLKRFIPPPQQSLRPDVDSFIELLSSAKRPLLLLGAGIHCAHASTLADQFVHRYRIPTVLTWGGADLLSEEDSFNMGRVGVCGPRGGNFAVQSADLIIAVGTRLSQMVTGGKQNLFAPNAKKVMVDIDAEELNKFDKTTIEIDLPIHSDIETFFIACLEKELPPYDFTDWQNRIQDWRRRYPLFTPDDYSGERVNPYVFIKELSKHAQEGDVIIGDTGANLSWTCQAFEFKKRQRIFSAWNHTPMGYSLPASVGAAFATDKNILCLIGDGGLMMCLEELATIRRFDLPIRIFLFDNQGHGIQKQTIDTWLNSRYVGTDVASGLYFPNYEKIAEAFSLPYFCLENGRDVQENLKAIYEQAPPYLCNIKVIEDQKIIPMLKFGMGLEDLNPKLSQKELEEIKQEMMVIK